MQVLVTGSSGLIGSAAVAHYDQQGAAVTGVDNNMRAEFFGPQGDTTKNLVRLQSQTRRFAHSPIDIRDRSAVFALFADRRFDLVIHCAAQPSHDKAKDIPLVDFDVNAVGTLNLLEATRRYCPDAAFIFMSTNKVYGDAPNEIPLKELETRWEYACPEDHEGINETCRIDQTLHSLFGASKVAADVMTQEYGRYFGLKTGVFRGGCLTGPSHAGVELHGFLSYLVHVAVHVKPYTIYGYHGKQVRDQIHASDVIRAFDTFAAEPRPGEVYNLGGGRANSASVLECIELVSKICGRRIDASYSKTNRVGDHICYISDMRKFKTHYPSWRLHHDLPTIIAQMVDAELRARRAAA